MSPITETPVARAAARTFRILRQPALARALAALFILVAVAFAAVLLLIPSPTWPRSWLDVLVFALAGGFTLYTDRAMAACRLTVDDRGIRFENRARGGSATQYPRPWSVEWKDIDHVVANPTLGIVQLKYKGRIVPIKILVRQWVAEDAPEPTAKRALFKRADPAQSQLWRELAARGLFEPGRFGAGRNISDFDMAKHPATRASLIAGVIVLAYGIADLGVHPKPSFLVPSIVIAAFVAAATFMVVYRWRRPYAVPIAVTAVVTLFMGGATLIAAWAALSHWA